MTHDLAVDIKIGDHYTVGSGFLTFNIDTIWTTVLAGAIVIGLGLFVRSRITSGVPNGVQLFWETVVGGLQDQVEANMGSKAPFVAPLAITIFVFVLISNWLELIPTNGILKSPSADVNFTYALGLLVIIWVHVAGARRQGPFRYLKNVVLPPGRPKILAPVNVIEELVKPFTLALRLFGNIFAGGIMVSLIGLLPLIIFPAVGNVGWKLFDMFIGVIQAFIFALLTILYFGFSFEAEHEENY
jgi:F-type H+-transporting ATPase subunit a